MCPCRVYPVETHHLEFGVHLWYTSHLLGGRTWRCQLVCCICNTQTFFVWSHHCMWLCLFRDQWLVLHVRQLRSPGRHHQRSIIQLVCVSICLRDSCIFGVSCGGELESDKKPFICFLCIYKVMTQSTRFIVLVYKSRWQKKETGLELSRRRNK